MNTKQESNEIVYSVSKIEFQEQSEIYLGRKMSERELFKAMSLLSMCMTESIGYTYSTVFDLLVKNKKLKRDK
ncbi:MAG: hypothetical protein IPL26_11480 [Leptospiraceae bacterium]|nr:hypothetical protein [Leptospiraceae bacterium]